MRFDTRNLIVPLIAAFVLVLTVQETTSALKASGAWRTAIRGKPVKTDDPYARIDAVLGRHSGVVSSDVVKNPFIFGGGRVVRPTTTPRPHQPAPPPQPVAPARPQLTSIVFDQDPRATVRYDGREFSVRANSLFADFRVVSITSNQVVLDRNGERTVLSLRPRGD